MNNKKKYYFISNRRVKLYIKTNRTFCDSGHSWSSAHNFLGVTCCNRRSISWGVYWATRVSQVSFKLDGSNSHTPSSACSISACCNSLMVLYMICVIFILVLFIFFKLDGSNSHTPSSACSISACVAIV